MRRLSCVMLVLAAASLLWGSGPDTFTVQLCDLAKEPLKYKGKTVRLKTDLIGRTFMSRTCPNVSGTLYLSLPENDAEPQGKRLAQLLDARSEVPARNHDCARVCFQYEVTVTLVGRVDAVPVYYSLKDPKTNMTSSYQSIGFGPEGLMPAQLAVTDVSGIEQRFADPARQSDFCPCLRF